MYASFAYRFVCWYIEVLVKKYSCPTVYRLAVFQLAEKLRGGELSPKMSHLGRFCEKIHLFYSD
jgi:hypothetical protein